MPSVDGPLEVAHRCGTQRHEEPVRDEDEELGLSEAIWPERERQEDRERMSRVDLDLGPLVLC
jgi:hypothetical protein